MLGEQPVARAGRIEDRVAVKEDPLRQQPIAGAQRVHQYDVVGTFADRLVQFDV
ncbi:hypothetical protein D3C87_2026360 [compost metagenome]